MPAWNNWFHCMGNTYGAWPRGDARGWRSRHHREHVEGDYKNRPPADRDAEILRHSKSLMNREAIVLDFTARVEACRCMADSLLFHTVELVDLVVCAQHFHLLARFAPLQTGGVPQTRFTATGKPIDDPPRHFVGLAKKESSRTLVENGGVPRGGAWAVRGKILPIESRSHQLSVMGYIRDHLEEGGALWSVLRKSEGWK